LRENNGILYDVIVIGAGAAGLMAAGTAAESGRRVLLLEKMEKAGRKIRITGKGRCNVTNLAPHEEFLRHVRWRDRFFRPAFEAFDNRATFDFFTGLGVRLGVERGERVFPESGDAWEIANALVHWCEQNGVEIRYHSRVTGIDAEDDAIAGVRFEVEGKEEYIPCQNVILCTGGVSYPATGSTGDGYAFADRLGHTVCEVRPSLVPLEYRLPAGTPPDGVELRNVKVRLLVDGRPRGEEFGEMEFTASTVAGPVILRLSRNAVDALIEEKRVELAIDLKPAVTTEQLTARIEREVAALPLGATVNDLLRKLLPKGMAPAMATKIRVPRRAMIREMTPTRCELLVNALKHFLLTVTDYRPFEEAIVTAGGIDVDDLDALTLESRIVQGLYFAGEILDIDADTGGYNLQIAFSTGRMAGQLKGSGASANALESSLPAEQP